MSSRTGIICLLLSLLVSSGLAGPVLPASIQREIVAYFAKSFAVEPEAVALKIYHSPEIDRGSIHHRQICVESRRGSARLGHQTLWIVLRKGVRIEREYPVTLSASVKMAVLVAHEKIDYGEALTAEKVQLKRMRITADLDQYFRESAIDSGLIARQLIRPGDVIQRSMLKRKPVVRRGEIISVHLRTGDILIKAKGRAREDGFIGDRIDVFVEPTRKYMTGEVRSAAVVAIKL